MFFRPHILGTMFVEDSGSRADATIGSSPVTEGQGPATLLSESEQHIRDIVDKITSRNLNHGGGRKATGGAWLRESNCIVSAVVVGKRIKNENVVEDLSKIFVNKSTSYFHSVAALLLLNPVFL